MNKGISNSTGGWLYFLGADDMLIDDTILFEVFKTKIDNSYTIISGTVMYHDGTTPFIYSKSKKRKHPSWNALMWVRNGLHHQGTFYKRSLFKDRLFNTSYNILADYAFNLMLFKSKEKCFVISKVIAKCSGNGISKSGTWQLYKEEFEMKMKSSLFFFVVIHYPIIVVKYFFRRLINV